jgi:anti-anti-sigma regulatory factor
VTATDLVNPRADSLAPPSHGPAMQATAESNLLAAPVRLISETRVEFRSAALDSLARASASGTALLAIDMAETRDVDASGLGALVLVQKRARERGITTQLLNTQHAVRSLLTLTKLEGLFEFA